MDYDNKKFIKVIGYFICFVLIVILFFVFDLSRDSNNKLFKQFDYVYENKSDYVSDYVSGIPQINVLSEEVNKVNSIIISNYYDVVTADYSSYSYMYGMYGNYLSLVIETNVYDDSEYGSISYYGYYVDLESGKLLSDAEFLEKLNISNECIYNSLRDRFYKFYSNDSLSNSMVFDDYYDLIYNDDVVYLIKDNSLYLYMVINYTHDIIEDSSYGNIYEYYINELDA